MNYTKCKFILSNQFNAIPFHMESIKSHTKAVTDMSNQYDMRDNATVCIKCYSLQLAYPNFRKCISDLRHI